MSLTDQELMRRAIALARRAEGMTSPNPLVGCVIARDGVAVGEGWHRGPGTDHAEVDALAAAGEAAKGATAYVTLEPCHHHGNTPPCTGALVAAGVGRVVYGASDPNPIAAGGADYLISSGIEVAKAEGEVAGDADALIRPWAHAIQSERPYVYAKWAGTLDGRTATRTGASKWITGPEARAHGHQLRQRTDAIIVGIGTILADDPSLDPRPEGVEPQPSLKIVLDSSLRCPTDAKVLGSPGPTLIVCADTASSAQATDLERCGAEIMRVSHRDGHLSLHDVLIALRSRGLISVMIEGGATLLGHAFDYGLVDEVWSYVAPRIMGGGQMAVAGDGPDAVLGAWTLSDMAIEKLGADYLIRGYAQKGAA